MENVVVRKIAGRGRLGNWNWGATVIRDEKVLLEELKELKKHIGEKVLLTGGGGPGAHIGKLVDAWLEDYTYMNKKGKGLRVRLVDLDPPIAGMREFTPWIDSWQISVFEPKNSE